MISVKSFYVDIICCVFAGVTSAPGANFASGWVQGVTLSCQALAMRSWLSQASKIARRSGFSPTVRMNARSLQRLTNPWRDDVHLRMRSAPVLVAFKNFIMFCFF